MTSTSSAFFFFFQAEDGIRDVAVTGVQTCALPIFYGGAMDKPRHPQVIRPWKTHQTQKNKSRSLTTTGQRGERSKRSEEHTSELQSRLHLVCRLLLEKKKVATDVTATTPHSLRITI